MKRYYYPQENRYGTAVSKPIDGKLSILFDDVFVSTLVDVSDVKRVEAPAHPGLRHYLKMRRKVFRQFEKLVSMAEMAQSLLAQGGILNGTMVKIQRGDVRVMIDLLEQDLLEIRPESRALSVECNVQRGHDVCRRHTYSYCHDIADLERVVAALKSVSVADILDATVYKSLGGTQS